MARKRTSGGMLHAEQKSVHVAGHRQGKRLNDFGLRGMDGLHCLGAY